MRPGKRIETRGRNFGVKIEDNGYGGDNKMNDKAKQNGLDGSNGWFGQKGVEPRNESDNRSKGSEREMGGVHAQKQMRISKSIFVSYRIVFIVSMHGMFME